MALFLGISISVASLYSFNEYLVGKGGIAVVVFFLFQEFVFYLYSVFLAPLNEFALEIHLFVCHFIEVDKFGEDTFLYKLHAGIIAFV